jgi:hypothetical protein
MSQGKPASPSDSSFQSTTNKGNSSGQSHGQNDQIREGSKEISNKHERDQSTGVGCMGCLHDCINMAALSSFKLS